MISFHDFILPNGLRLVVHPVKESQIAIFNLMYNVGSGNEDPDKTGLAHLFEHMMFSTSKHVPS